MSLFNTPRRWGFVWPLSMSEKQKLELARKLGAEITVDASSEDPARQIQEQTGGAHGVLVTAVSPIAFKQAVGMLRRRGTCVLVGLPPGEFPVSIFDVVLSRYTLRGSIVGTRKDLEEALGFAAQGKVKATMSSFRSSQSMKFSTG